MSYNGDIVTNRFDCQIFSDKADNDGIKKKAGPGQKSCPGRPLDFN